MKTLVLIGIGAAAVGAYLYFKSKSTATAGSTSGTGAAAGDDSLIGSIAAKIDAAAAADKAALASLMSGGAGTSSGASDSNQAIGTEVEVQSLLQQIKNVFSVNGNYGLGDGGDPSTQADAQVAKSTRLGLNLATTTV